MLLVECGMLNAASQFTRGRKVDSYRLLVLDDYESYYSDDFEEYYKENNILTLYIPTYSSYLL